MGVGDLRKGGGGIGSSSNSPSSGDDVACRLLGRESSEGGALRLTGVDSICNDSDEFAVLHDVNELELGLRGAGGEWLEGNKQIRRPKQQAIPAWIRHSPTRARFVSTHRLLDSSTLNHVPDEALSRAKSHEFGPHFRFSDRYTGQLERGPFYAI